MFAMAAVIAMAVPGLKDCKICATLQVCLVTEKPRALVNLIFKFTCIDWELSSTFRYYSVWNVLAHATRRIGTATDKVQRKSIWNLQHFAESLGGVSSPGFTPKLRLQPEAIAFCSIILAYAAYNSANTKWGDGFQGMKFQLLRSRVLRSVDPRDTPQ